jgi:hypothetical protein
VRPTIDLAFPKSAPEFYRLRDDRTNRCVQSREYQLATCVVSVDSASIKSLAGQTTLLIACNLLSRWCRHVEIILPLQDLETASGRGENLGDTILRSMHDADPFGRFSLSDHASTPGSLRLHVGANPNFEDAAATVVNASGWIACIGTSRAPVLPTPSGSNIVGAVAAACLGVAQIFKRALRMPREALISDGVFDLFRLQRIPADEIRGTGPTIHGVHPGKILLVGAGSVGSAFAYCLQLSAADCEVAVVDKDLVMVENFNRSPLFGRANFGWRKADAVQQALLSASISAVSFPMTWDGFIHNHGRKPSEFDVWLPLANEDNVRMAMQSNVPPLLVYAATNRNWGASYGRWTPGRDDCLIDRFPPPSLDATLGCSEGEIETPQGKIDAALPFLSMFAGLMVFADLIRLQLPNYPQVPNYASFDFGASLETIQKWDMRPRPGCSCTTLSPSLYKSFNRLGKYFGLAFS